MSIQDRFGGDRGSEDNVDISPPDRLPAAAPASSMLAAVEGRVGPVALQRRLLQRRAAQRTAAQGDAAATAERGIAGSGDDLPFKSQIQRSFGSHDVSGVRAHTDGGAQAGARSLGAEAFTYGNHVAFAGTPTLHTAAHEAAHTIQQQAGIQLKGGVGEEGDVHEQHADAVADRVVAGRSAEDLLDTYRGSGSRAAEAPGAQRKALQLKPMVPNPGGGKDLVDAEKWRATDWMSWYRTYLKVQQGAPGYTMAEGFNQAEWTKAATQDPDVAGYMNEFQNNIHMPLGIEAEELRDQKRDSAKIAAALQLIKDFEASGGGGANTNSSSSSSSAPSFAFRTLDGKHAYICDRLRKLVKNPILLNQSEYGICGTNTFLHSLLITDPQAFVKYVVDLIKSGKAVLGITPDAGHEIKATKDVRKKDTYKKKVENANENARREVENEDRKKQGKSKRKMKETRDIHPVDFVAMGSLRADKNKACTNIKSGNSGLLHGVSTLGEIKSWYAKSGYEIVREMHAKVTDLGSGLSVAELQQLQGLFGTCEVALWINAMRIPDEKTVGDGGGSGSSGNHFVLLASDIVIDGTHVHMQVWSWGSVRKLSLPHHRVPKVINGCVVARPPAKATVPYVDDRGLSEAEESDRTDSSEGVSDSGEEKSPRLRLIEKKEKKEKESDSESSSSEEEKSPRRDHDDSGYDADDEGRSYG